jgi:hypothetical protein
MAKHDAKTYRVEVKYDWEWQTVGLVQADDVAAAVRKGRRDARKIGYALPRCTKWRARLARGLEKIRA